MLAMRSELKEEGITVQLIAPAIVQTDLLRASTDKNTGIPAEASVEGLLRVVDSINIETRNKMINYAGNYRVSK